MLKKLLYLFHVIVRTDNAKHLNSCAYHFCVIHLECLQSDGASFSWKLGVGFGSLINKPRQIFQITRRYCKLFMPSKAFAMRPVEDKPLPNRVIRVFCHPNW